MLKQAREACVIKRDEGNRQKRRNANPEPIAAKPKITRLTTPEKSPNSQSQPPKMCKIQFQDSEEESEEEFAEILPSCSRSVPIQNSQNSVKIRFRLADDSGSEREDVENIEDDDLQQQLVKFAINVLRS